MKTKNNTQINNTCNKQEDLSEYLEKFKKNKRQIKKQNNKQFIFENNDSIDDFLG